MKKDSFFKIVRDYIKEGFKKAFPNITVDSFNLTLPAEVKYGTFTLACFPYARELKLKPSLIAQRIAQEMKSNSMIAKVEAVGPYLNIFLDNQFYFEHVCRSSIEQLLAMAAGKFSEPTGKKMMVEYLSPNTNKPLHLGHLRNGSLGISISNILEASGNKVIRANLVNDRGVHICKSMLAWKKWSDGATPESVGKKGDHFVGDCYVRYAQELDKDPSLKEAVLAMLAQWESGDLETISLWKKMNDWVYAGFDQTYDRFGIRFDKFYYESETYRLGKDIVEEGLKKGTFRKDETGNTVYDLPTGEFGANKDGSPRRVTVLRPDGTSLYLTQDLGTAKLKVEDYSLDNSIYVVASEQVFHFKSLFHILEALGFDWAKGCYHLSYEMVLLPEGRMKSREGKVVDADGLMDEMVKLALAEIKKRHVGEDLNAEEIASRAEKIGIGAIKYYLLRVNPNQTMVFDPRESISFDGFTGPYCQYAYARACGILKKAGVGIEDNEIPSDSNFSSLGDNLEEQLLAQKLLQFFEVIGVAAKEYNPSKLAVHVYELARSFNQFYNKHPVIGGNDPSLTAARIALVKAVKLALKEGLVLLGIDAIPEM